MGQDDQDGQGQDPGEIAADNTFERLKSQDTRTERRIFWRELAIISTVALLATAYLVAILIKLGSLPALRW